MNNFNLIYFLVTKMFLALGALISLAAIAGGVFAIYIMARTLDE